MRFMLLAIALVAAMIMDSRSSRAEIEYPWCVMFGDSDGGSAENCGFVSYEQCMQTARGMGGSCYRNLRYVEPAPRVRQKKRRQ